MQLNVLAYDSVSLAGFRNPFCNSNRDVIQEVIEARFGCSEQYSLDNLARQTNDVKQQLIQQDLPALK